MEQYDAHMKKILPKPELLPVRIDLVIERLPTGLNANPSNIDLPNIFQVKPFENVASLVDSVKQFYEKKQETITTFEVESITIQGPFFNREEDQKMQEEEEGQIVDASARKVGSSGTITVAQDQLEERSFNELGVTVQSSKVFIRAKIEFKSEEPLDCITCTYSKDDPANTHYDYYSCKTCNINWICVNCSIGCHGGHETLPHVMNHRPTYACCYCMKKKVCKIKNLKNMNK